MLLLGLDFETSGLDPKTEQIIEIGAVLWCHEKNKPLKLFSEMLQLEEGRELSPTITDITGITQEDLQSFGVPLHEAMTDLLDLIDKADYIVAHNGNKFDKLFLENALSALDLSYNKAWIDTMTDVPYPEAMKTRNLVHLAAEHKFLNPFAHRALFDVLSMLEVFKNYSLQSVLDLQSSPLIKVVAQVSYEERNKAKESGFRWDPQGKVWFKEMKECSLKEAAYPFTIQVQ